MAPPPFKVIGDLPRPLTVKETAKTLRVSPQKLSETLAALVLVLKDERAPLASSKARQAGNLAKRAKAGKTLTKTKPAKTRPKAKKSAVRSGR
jgi:hypothetical protein